MCFWRHSSGLALGLVIALTPRCEAADQIKIQPAITRGLEYLKSLQDPATGTWPFSEARVGAAQTGATALAGVTLLECGLPGNDPAVQKAAEMVRQASIGLTQTYGLSVSILFLDRLGEPADSALIQSMAVRLLGGQNASGGWSYECPPISRQEVARLTAQLRKPDDRPKPRPTPSTASPRDRRSLPPEIQKQLNQISAQGVGQPPFSDNSNTKFATLALWVGRRHGIPVEKALARVEARFRTSQNPDGGWGYVPEGGRGRFGMPESLESMTCAGLLGLATARGAANEATLRTDFGARDVKSALKKPRPDPSRDPVIQAGLLLLGKAIGSAKHSPIQWFGSREGDEYYFLWAMERVAVAYGLQTIGNKDWYGWGSDLLLAQQAQDGGWHGKYEGGVDTCFALLFLKRANLSRDLTVSLRGQVRDPAAKGADVPPLIDPGPEKPEPKPAADSAQASRSGRTSAPVPAREKVAPAATTNDSDLDRETASLSADMVNAAPTQQKELLETYLNAKGVAYTQALAAAIPKLSVPIKTQAQNVLAERLARMTDATLRARLKDEDTEIRRAAALACAMKEDKSRIPDLIALLEDDQSSVVRAAHAALKSLTKEDFGPKPGSTKPDQSAAAAAWRAWWKEQRNK